MKKLKYIAGAGALMLFTALSSVSCTDGNDWDVDGSYDRLFSVVSSSLSVSAETTTAEVKWAKTPNTEYYVIEVSKDSLYDEIPMNTGNATVFGEDKSIVTSPYTLSNLDSDSKYFIRIKALSSAKAESKWSYLEKYAFETKAEQILDGVTAITGRSAIVSWDSSLAVTHLLIHKDKGTEATEAQRIALTDADKSIGTYKLTDLEAKTAYVVSIWNNEVQRGLLKFTTTEAYPEGYDVVTVESTAALNDLFTNPADYITGNNGNMVIVFPKGSSLNMAGDGNILTVPAALKSVIFWGEAGGDKAVFMPKGLGFEGTHETVRFYNLDIQNESSGGDYVINQNVNGTITNLSIEDCTVSKTRGVLRVQGDGAQGSIDNFTISNTILTDIGSYAIVNSKLSGFAWKTINFSNSTFNTVNAGGVIITQQGNIAMNIDNCTFYNCVTTGKSFIDINKMSGVTVSVNKTIIGQLYNYADGSTIKAYSVKNIATANDVYTTSDCPYASGYDWGTILEKTSAQLFVDPVNGDFHIQNGAVNAGDPRWLSE